MPGSVHHRIEESIGWIVFDHPERRNAISANMWTELATAIRSLAGDERVRVVLMRGAGEVAFVSGADISQFDGEDGASTSAGLEKAGGEAFRELASLGKPLIAMIHGYCIGGGLAVALHADMRYSAEDALFGIPAARLGVGYGLGGIESLERVVGPAWAREILFTAKRYGAEEALQMGLVNRVVPKAELEAMSLEVARQIAANAPLTVQSVKALSRELEREPAKRNQQMIAGATRACFESEDFAEGVTAFMEKRKPDFKGR